MKTKVRAPSTCGECGQNLEHDENLIEALKNNVRLAKNIAEVENLKNQELEKQLVIAAKKQKIAVISAVTEAYIEVNNLLAKSNVSIEVAEALAKLLERKTRGFMAELTQINES